MHRTTARQQHGHRTGAQQQGHWSRAPANNKDVGPKQHDIDSGLEPLHDGDDAGTEPTLSSLRMGSTELPHGDNTATEPCATTITWVQNTRMAMTAQAPSLHKTMTTWAPSPCEMTTA